MTHGGSTVATASKDLDKSYKAEALSQNGYGKLVFLTHSEWKALRQLLILLPMMPLVK